MEGIKMSSTTQLVRQAAHETVQNITDRYDDYHQHLVEKFVEILRIQNFEPNEQARGRAIAKLVEAFADQASVNLLGEPDEN